jgi:hypothetical protein
MGNAETFKGLLNRKLSYGTLMMIRHFACLGVILLACWKSEPSWGATNIWTFNGKITQGLDGGPYKAGLAYSMNFTVSTPQLWPAGPGLYFATTGYSFEANRGGVGASSVGSGILVANDQPLSGGGCFDGIIFSMFGEPDTTFPSGILFDGSATGITLVSSSPGLTASPFTDTSFPSTLDLNQFSQRYMTMPFSTGTVEGTVDSLYLNGQLVSRVPEPSSLALLGAGLSALLALRRRMAYAG